MPFSALPDDILLPILSDAFPTAADLTDWKRQLAVLSISQQVRQLMLPKIYCDVFIMSYFEDSLSNDNTVVKTNIKLAAATGNFHFARVLNIKALYQLRQLVALESAINALTPHSGHLDHITELEVVLTYDNDCDYNAKNSIVLAEDSMVCNAERIVELVPNITSIFYYGFTRNHSTAPFYSTLISSRAGQLSRLTHHAPFDFPPFIVFSQITHLDIQLDVNNTDNLPRICPDTIQYLRIINLPTGYTWGLFGYNDVPGAMTLPSITEIDIQYSECPAIDNQVDFEAAGQCKIHTPRLHTLELYGRVRLPLLRSIVLPKLMESINIETYAGVILSLQTTVLPKTKRLVLRVNNDPSAVPELYGITNSLVNSAQGYVRSFFATYALQPAVTSKSICCPSLTKLMIHTKIDPAALIRIISSHSNLMSLSTSQLITENVPSDIAVPDSKDAHTLPPLSTKLWQLTLLCTNTNLYYNAYKRYSRYLVLRLPTLTDIEIEPPLYKIWDEFVSEHGLSYPHLANVKIST